jgi:hypothetical protein
MVALAIAENKKTIIGNPDSQTCFKFLSQIHLRWRQWKSYQFRQCFPIPFLYSLDKRVGKEGSPGVIYANEIAYGCVDIDVELRRRLFFMDRVEGVVLIRHVKGVQYEVDDKTDLWAKRCLQGVSTLGSVRFKTKKDYWS